MALNPLRRDVLKCYKQLLRTREKIFQGDQYALDLTKQKAREHFAEKKHLTDVAEIEAALKVGRDSIEVLRTTVVQGKLNDVGNYRIKLENEHIY